jgi:hypothetical protein
MNPLGVGISSSVLGLALEFLLLGIWRGISETYRIVEAHTVELVEAL